MTPIHHPSDAMLLAYAAGTLGEGMSLAVATHLATCPACRAAVRRAETLGGALLDDLEPATMAAGSREAVLASLDVVISRPSAPRPAPRQDDGLPSVLRPYLGAARMDDLWRRLAPGIQQIELLPRGSHGTARLLKIAPGRVLPEHGHFGSELTVVLHGSFSDELGRFGPGDVAEVDDETVHQPIADADRDCICLIATEAPLRFTGFVHRLMQPFIGI